MAQLVAHLHGMEGVGSSNLPSSTGKAFEVFLGSLFHIVFALYPAVPCFLFLSGLLSVWPVISQENVCLRYTLEYIS